MPTVHIEKLETEEEWSDAYPAVVQLWKDAPHQVTEESFIQIIHELQTIEGYRLFALFVNECVAVVAGVAIRMNVWYGRYLWVHDLVTDDNHRSRGFGTKMMSYLKEWAKDHGCETIALASALKREDEHQFYEQSGMEKSSYVFTERLD